MNPPLDEVDLLSEQGMKGVGDPEQKSPLRRGMQLVYWAKTRFMSSAQE